jgi:hypothetical protein
VVRSSELVSRKETAEGLVHNRVLPSQMWKEVRSQAGHFYNRIFLRRSNREKEQEAVYICMLFVDTSKTGNNVMLCFGLFLLQFIGAGNSVFPEGCMQRSMSEEGKERCKRHREEYTREVSTCRLIHEPGYSGQSKLLTVTAKQAVDLSRMVSVWQHHWNFGNGGSERCVWRVYDLSKRSGQRRGWTRQDPMAAGECSPERIIMCLG